MSPDEIRIALFEFLRQGGAFDFAMQARPFSWEVQERDITLGPPEGNGWEPFAATSKAIDGSSYATLVCWRRPL